MYLRDGKSRDETWLRGKIEAMGLDDRAFDPQAYVIAVEEDTNQRAGFGRLRIQTAEPAIGELTSIGVDRSWRGQGVGAHVLERLLTKAGDAGVETVYLLTDEPGYPAQFGFNRVDSDLPPPLADRRADKQTVLADEVIALTIDSDSFEMPARLREAFKTATGAHKEPTVDSEEFGIDAEGATYKYDTGR